MEPNKCNVGLRPDPKYGYQITLEGNCEKLVTDIHNNQGKYGRRYLDDRLIYVEKTPEPKPQQNASPQEPVTKDSTNIPE